MAESCGCIFTQLCKSCDHGSAGITGHHGIVIRDDRVTADANAAASSRAAEERRANEVRIEDTSNWVGPAMSEQHFSENRNESDIPSSGTTNLWRRHVPYLLILALALAGVAYSNMSQKPLAGYWELVALITGGVSIFTEWDKNEERRARVRLIWTQAVRWIAVLVAMNIMLLAGVQQLLPAPATSLVLLMLLALGSFLAGLNLASLELCFLGLVLALAVPTISWVKQSMLFIILGAALVVGIGMTFWSSRKEN